MSVHVQVIKLLTSTSVSMLQYELKKVTIKTVYSYMYVIVV